MRETWENIVKKYPCMWVAVKDPQMDGPNIISGIVFAVKTDDEIIDYEDEHVGEGLIYRRTTGGESNGPIRANFIVETA